MERWMSGWSAVIIWGAFNTVLVLILAGFTASGFIGGAGRSGILEFSLYAASVTLVFLIGLVIWLGRRRIRGLRVPPRPGVSLLLALGIAMGCLGLAYGWWVSMFGAAPILAALVLELYPRDRP